MQAKQSSTQQMERLPNRYPKISQSHKVPLYKGLSLFYPKLRKINGNLCTCALQSLHLSSAISALMPSDCVRRPIGLRPPSNQIASAVRSGGVRCPMKKCGAEYIRSTTSTVSFLSTWAAQWCPLRGTGSRRWPSRALLRGWLPRHRADSRRNKGGTSVRLRRCRLAWG